MKPCPICNKGHIISHVITEKFMYDYVFLEYDKIEEFCCSCGSLYQPIEVIKENVQRKGEAIDAYMASLQN